MADECKTNRQCNAKSADACIASPGSIADECKVNRIRTVCHVVAGVSRVIQALCSISVCVDYEMTHSFVQSSFYVPVQRWACRGSSTHCAASPRTGAVVAARWQRLHMLPAAHCLCPAPKSSIKGACQLAGALGHTPHLVHIHTPQ
eukprot:1151509-Pelagomonas_calceolata.AAC.1